MEDKGVGKKRDVSHTYKECLRCVGILMTAPFVYYTVSIMHRKKKKEIEITTMQWELHGDGPGINVD